MVKKKHRQYVNLTLAKIPTLDFSCIRWKTSVCFFMLWHMRLSHTSQAKHKKLMKNKNYRQWNKSHQITSEHSLRGFWLRFLSILFVFVLFGFLYLTRYNVIKRRVKHLEEKKRSYISIQITIRHWCIQRLRCHQGTFGGDRYSCTCTANMYNSLLTCQCNN